MKGVSHERKLFETMIQLCLTFLSAEMVETSNNGATKFKDDCFPCRQIRGKFLDFRLSVHFATLSFPPCLGTESAGPNARNDWLSRKSRSGFVICSPPLTDYT